MLISHSESVILVFYLRTINLFQYFQKMFSEMKAIQNKILNKLFFMEVILSIILIFSFLWDQDFFLLMTW